MIDSDRSPRRCSSTTGTRPRTRSLVTGDPPVPRLVYTGPGRRRKRCGYNGGFMITARKPSLGQGNVFIGVCLSTGGAVGIPDTSQVT